MYEGFQAYPFVDDLVLISGGAILAGFALIETGGVSPVTVTFRDGEAATAEVLCPLRIAAGGSAFSMPSSEGIEAERGIFADVTGAGTLVAVAFIVPLTGLGRRTYFATNDTESLGLDALLAGS